MDERITDVTEWLFPGGFAEVLTPLSQPYGDGWHMMPGMGGGMWLMLIFWIILFVLVILAIVALWRFIRGGSAPRQNGNADRPLEILRERFARGEIDQEEFEARRKALNR